ncbi:MAG TPA: acyl carrier protein [Rhizobiales bacterium]|nr:acyl carrier protein [Hyphomicrobiales bacterium]
MSASKEEILGKLKELLQKFNSNNIELTETTDISTDLNIDSVAVMDFIMEVEDAYDIDIPLNVLSETRTMADLAAVVQKELG